MHLQSDKANRWHDSVNAVLNYNDIQIHKKLFFIRNSCLVELNFMWNNVTKYIYVYRFIQVKSMGVAPRIVHTLFKRWTQKV